ncbi:MAG: UDP-N-acetylmuramoyl-L-alanine--D-glutamate ligase, partial [Leucobacter sp.]
MAAAAVSGLENGSATGGGAGSGRRARAEALASWHDDWSGLRVAVLGLGAVEFSAADTLVELGARVRVIHEGQDPDLERLLDVIGSERFSSDDPAGRIRDLAAFAPDLVVAPSALSAAHPLAEWADANAVPLWGDLELGWRLRDKTPRVADWISVTGSRDTAETVRLVAHMLVAAGLRAVPSDAGSPILDALRDPQGYDAIVVELSAEQLLRARGVSPYASVCLDFSSESGDEKPADRARGALARVYERTQVACVYNRADPETERMVEEADVIE